MGPHSPLYAAPEQFANKKDLIDPRTDFFNLGIIALELYLGVHPFDPAFVGNQNSISENIMQNKYILETNTVKRDTAIASFAIKTLQTQPYQRFRNYNLLDTFITENLSL